MKFDDLFVLKQLKYTGLLETTRIRREGYPSRLLFEEFLNRYVNTDLYSMLQPQLTD